MSDTFQFSLNAIRFEDVRSEIVRFLTEQGTYDSPLDFEGSNLAYIIDTMAYTTMLMSYMLSTIANDNFLDTTSLRKNAVSIAKTLGYKPKRIQASRMEGFFTYAPGDQIFTEESRIIIPANTHFTGEEDGYTWINTDPIYLYVNPKNPFELTSEANEVKPRITLVQGVYKKFSVFGSGISLQNFSIPSTKIDENNMKVSVYTTQNGESTKIEWTHAKTFFDIQSEEIYFLEEDILFEGTPKVVFGNGIVGRIPSLTETIIVDYLETLGPIANGEINISLPEDLVPNRSFDISAVNLGNLIFHPAAPSFGGQDYETIESIKANAPRFFAAAGRAVTANDYTTLIKNEFDYVLDEVNVIGGDELESGNKAYLGNSYITAIPNGTNDSENFTESLQLYLTESDETKIISHLRSSGIIATKKYFLKPSYIFLDINPSIEVDSRITASELKYTEEQTYEILVNYFNENFKGFNNAYRASKVTSQVDVLKNVISTNIDTNYGFPLNRDTFYIDRESIIYLPVRYQKLNNQIIRNNWNELPLTTNFIKKNEQIITDNNLSNQSIIELFRVQVSGTRVEDVHFTLRTAIWHGRDVDEKYTDQVWEVQIEDTTDTVLPATWNILLSSKDHTEFYTIGSVEVTAARQVNITENDTYSAIDLPDFFRNIVEVNSEFDIIDANPVAGIFYTSVRLRRRFNKYNLLPEVINGNMSGRTSIRGILTHRDLYRYMFNNDSFKVRIAQLNVIDNINKSLVQKTYSFTGQGSSQYTVSISKVEEIGSISTYNVQLNNTVSEERQRAAVLTWDKSLSGVDQFDLSTIEEDVTWLSEQGFEAQLKEQIGTQLFYSVLQIEVDENENFYIYLRLDSAISSIKLYEKNLLGIFEFDDSLAEGSKFKFIDFYTRSFTDENIQKQPLDFSEQDLTSVSARWSTEPVFTITETASNLLGYEITSINDDLLTAFGLKKEVVLEPIRYTTLNEVNETAVRRGIAVYSYGIFHDTVIGFFEYETGKLNFNRIIEGNKNGAHDTISTETIHVRDYFNNYGITQNATKMDIITMIPDNDYEDIDGFNTIVGSLTDFDSVHTQTVRAKINAIESVQI